MTVNSNPNVEIINVEPLLTKECEFDYEFRQLKREEPNGDINGKVFILVEHMKINILHIDYFHRYKANKYFSKKFEKKRT